MFDTLSGSVAKWLSNSRRKRKSSHRTRSKPRGRIERLEDRVLLAAVSAQEQLFVYMLNLARHDPGTYATEQSLSVSLSYVTPRGPLAVNENLLNSAGFKATDMATNDYASHVSPTGKYPNALARDYGYPLPSWWPSDANFIESMHAGTYSSSAITVLNSLLVDANTSPPGHRNHLLGIDSFHADDREIGVGHAYSASSFYGNYWAIHATHRDPAGKFLTGVAYNDANGNSRYDLNEGIGGVTINAGGLTTTTNSEGGWSIKVSGSSYYVTASGGGFSGTASANVAISNDNVEVDFISGQSAGIIDFAGGQTTPGSQSRVGLYEWNNGRFALQSASGNHTNFCSGRYWMPVAGDWNGDGTDTVGLYDQANGVFHLKSVNAPGGQVNFFRCGAKNQGWLPLAGDWNGDGTDTVGLYDQANGVFHLKSVNAPGGQVNFFRCGAKNQGWMPLAGDWDGDGTDTVGLYDFDGGAFHLKSVNGAGGTVNAFRCGVQGRYYRPCPGVWYPVAGDWDADGDDTVGLYDSWYGAFHLKHANMQGGGVNAFGFGPKYAGGWLPIAGDWNGPGQALHAANPGATDPQAVIPLAPPDLQPIIQEAFSRWDTAGIEHDLSSVKFVLTDLPGTLLGWAELDTIYIDRDAAGHGWFVDDTPAGDEEFCPVSGVGESVAVDPRATDRVDLLTVVSHELGHHLGLADLDSAEHSLMSGTLATGLRRDPGPAEIDAYFGAL